MIEHTSERWLPVPSFEEMYEVSDGGNVRSVERKRRNRHGWKVWPAKPLKPFRTPSGRLHVRLYSGERRYKDFAVHRLVAWAFLGPSELDVLHWNDDPTDNRLENLRYGTDADNQADCVRNGHHKGAAQTHCKRNHEFTEENTYRAPGAPHRRQCLTCMKARRKRRYETLHQ